MSTQAIRNIVNNSISRIIPEVRKRLEARQLLAERGKNPNESVINDLTTFGTPMDMAGLLGIENSSFKTNIDRYRTNYTESDITLYSSLLDFSCHNNVDSSRFNPPSKMSKE